jgi:hypothetical protein
MGNRPADANRLKFALVHEEGLEPETTPQAEAQA